MLLASSLIPGNENAVYGVINGLTRCGANVVHKGNAKVHVSGHASAGELLYCYNVVRPANVMPVHGEWRHLQANAAIAIRTGVPADRVVLAEDGVVVDLVDGRRVDHRPGRPRATCTSTAATSATSPRRPSRTGACSPPRASSRWWSIVDADTGKLVEPPDFLARGFTHDEHTFDPVVPLIEKALETAAREGIGDVRRLEQLIQQTVSKWAHRTFRSSPIVIPVIVDA